MSDRGRQGEPSSEDVRFGREEMLRLFQELSESGRRMLILTDHHTRQHCLPRLPLIGFSNSHTFSVPPGESSKSMDVVTGIWQALSDHHFDRHDVLVNLGGGMVCDLGGFAASCFKRGVAFVHVPTSLLAMADAAVGGKTGINFAGAKNQIGTFQSATAVVINSEFLDTLPLRELQAGYAEVLKHFLIHDADAWHRAASGLHLPTDWNPVLEAAVRTKLHFTMADPTEKGIRKALNFGHTIGHALESHFLQQTAMPPLLHGEAVAAGMACEAFLACQRRLLRKTAFEEVWQTLHRIFGKIDFEVEDVAGIAAWCLQDKKNAGGKVNCTLLKGIGGFALDQWCTLKELEGCLQAYHSGFEERILP
jgi:3-dehydroquinate synthase